MSGILDFFKGIFGSKPAAPAASLPSTATALTMGQAPNPNIEKGRNSAMTFNVAATRINMNKKPGANLPVSAKAPPSPSGPVNIKFGGSRKRRTSRRKTQRRHRRK